MILLSIYNDYNFIYFYIQLLHKIPELFVKWGKLAKKPQAFKYLTNFIILVITDMCEICDYLKW